MRNIKIDGITYRWKRTKGNVSLAPNLVELANPELPFYDFLRQWRELEQRVEVLRWVLFASLEDVKITQWRWQPNTSLIFPAKQSRLAKKILKTLSCL